MSITSANPDDLDHFVTSARRARTPLEDRIASLRSQEHAVIANSPDFNVRSGALGSAGQVFADMDTNERFVDTIRKELLKADRDPSTGIVTVSSAAVATSLREAGLTQPPAPVQVEPGVLLGLPPTTGFVDDPICAANGNFVHVEHDLSHPGWSAVLDVVRVYNSLAADRPGSFGRGWTSVLDMHVDAGTHGTDGIVRAHLADGAVVPFTADADGVLRAAGTRPLTIERVGAEWHLREGNIKIWRFDTNGLFAGGVAPPASLEVTRDGGGRVEELRDGRSGRSVRYAWDGARIVSATSSDGRTATYRYDGDHLVEVQRPKGGVLYGIENGRVATVADADGVRLAVNTYDEDGRVLTQTNEFGRTTTYSYSEAGTTLVADTSGGPRNAFTHDRLGNVTSVVDGEGLALRLTYDESGRTTSVRDRTGAVTRFSYDAAGNLTERVDADGLSVAWTWDPLGRLTTERHRNGAITTYIYEGSHRRPSRIEAPLGGVIETHLSDDDVPTRITDADGVETNFEWDSDGQLVAITDSLGNRTSFSFDGYGNLTELVDGSGVTIALQPDAAGRVLASIVGGEPCASYEYSAAGRPVAGRDSTGVAWQAHYGEHGRLAAFTDAASSEVSFEWDLLGNLEAVVAPDGARYAHFYDRVGRLVAAQDPEGRESRRELDREGRVVAVIDPEGRTWRRRLDALGRTEATTSPDGAVTRYRYHATGDVAEVVDATGATTRTELDDEGRVVALTDATGSSFRFVWSRAGRLLERHYPSGRVERFSYDEAGRLVGRSGFGQDVRFDLDGRGRVIGAQTDDGTTSLAYNSAGEVIGVRTERAAVEVARDAAGRVVATRDSAGVGASYEFDLRGLLAAATGPDGLTAQYARDIRGRLASATAPTGETTAYGYDTTGFLSSVTDSTGTLQRVLDATGRATAVTAAGSTIERRLDAVGRLASVVSDGDEIASFSYDPVGRLAGARRGDSSMSFDWDPAGRLLAAVTDGADVSYGRDADGLLSEVAEGGHRVGVERDRTGRVSGLTDSVVGSLSRPELGARTSDVGGRITGGLNGSTYRYDDAGRLAEALDPDGGRWAFTYDDTGLLASEETPSGSRRYRRGILGRVEAIEHGDDVVETFAYDPAGRRVRTTRSDGFERRYDWDVAGSLVAVTDIGADGIERRLDVALDAFGRPVQLGEAQVVWDDAWTSKPLRVGERRYIHLGGLAREAREGADWQLRQADPWGSSAEPAAEARVGFLGELEAWGLVWLGARIYDTATREFLSPDPRPPVPGRPAFSSAYAYGFNDPVNFLDPSGARPVSQADFQAYLDRVEQGRLGQAWEAVKNDPWGTLAMIGVAAVGTALLFVPGAQVIGAGILIGVAANAVPGVLTGNFSPTSAAIGGVVGAIPGGNTLRGAVAFGAAAGAGQEVVTQAIRGDGMNWGNVAIQGTVGGATGGAIHGVRVRINGATPSVDVPAPPTARFAVDSGGVVTDLRPSEVDDMVRLAATELDFATAPNSAVFYSGPGNRTRALDFADENMRTPIDSTPGGKWLEDQQLYDRAGWSHADANRVWEVASTRYAEGASGTAVAFVEGAQPLGIFTQVEWPILQSNPNVTNVLSGGH